MVSPIPRHRVCRSSTTGINFPAFIFCCRSHSKYLTQLTQGEKRWMSNPCDLSTAESRLLSWYAVSFTIWSLLNGRCYWAGAILSSRVSYSIPSSHTISSLTVMWISFGNASRVDYGTGHETMFVCFLLCLEAIGLLNKSDHRVIVTHVFSKYISIVRMLQIKYWCVWNSLISFVELFSGCATGLSQLALGVHGGLMTTVFSHFTGKCCATRKCVTSCFFIH